MKPAWIVRERRRASLALTRVHRAKRRREEAERERKRKLSEAVRNLLSAGPGVVDHDKVRDHYRRLTADAGRARAFWAWRA